MEGYSSGEYRILCRTRPTPRALKACPVLLLAAVLLLSLVLPPGTRTARAGSLSGWKFCIDPGHGGSDPGAVGPTGLQEKEVNLKVALKLRDLLAAEGAEVLMTRESDVSVSITQRWQMANSWGADRFISVHHNSVSDSDVNYTITLVSKQASQESLALANAVQAELVAELGLPNNGVWLVDYCGVLNNTTMPAILTEASFISNPREEQLLRDDAYLAREAQAIFRGIRMPSRVSFIMPPENRPSSGRVAVSLQLVGLDSLQRVDLRLDGQLVGSRNAPPFDFTVDTSALDDGTYRLAADAFYLNGGSAAVSRDLVVANYAKKWYFAEGTTMDGFQEWLTVLNPNREAVDFTVSYHLADGDTVARSYRAEADARVTIQVAEEVGRGRDLGISVDSPLPLVVERPMYFLYDGKWAGGHVSSGISNPAKEWYFAEGYTGPGFQEYLCLLNPGAEDARVDVEYYCQGGLLAEESLVVPAGKRRTLDVNRSAGYGNEISVKVSSDREIVAERPMYFLYAGKWAGGHVSPGTSRPTQTWYFAEGYTGPGFQEYLCLYNPNGYVNRATITYQTSGGMSITDEEYLPPFSRRTVDVNRRAGSGLELSVMVQGDGPLVAERAIYHEYSRWCRGGDVAVGVKWPSRHWYFAEGYTGSGFENWLCIQNPSEQDLQGEVWISTESGELLKEKVTLPKRARTTLNLNSMVPYQEGISVSLHADGEVVAERPVYFRYYNGWVGGHVSCGYAPGMRK
ncbi:MAG: N-acetylmuramoyl-L-alanine amidase [Actinobacteria bacterium]|nr:N-acetylmuramoyl-L-alanine amidase [Actinomycetota bacterium]